MTGFLLAFALSTQSPSVQEWARQPAPGIEYRMLVQSEPKLTAVALRFAPNTPYFAAPAQARDQVYDLTPTNGRATLTEIVGRTGAIGGVNGDFFQWGNDPGGDPVNLMVRHGELLSAPGVSSPGGRAYGYGWGEGRFTMAQSSMSADSSFGKIVGLNCYTGIKDLTLSTPSAGYAISKKPATFVVLDIGAQILKPKGSLDGTVVQVVENVEKLRVNPGTAVLSTQENRNLLRAAKPGQKVRIKVSIDGFDWRKIHDVIGGGPVLLRDGKSLAPATGEFNADRHPRTIVGRDRQGGTWFIAIDGRQNQTLGASLPESAALALHFGLVDALNLDGGGSTTMSLFGTTLNRPSGGIERAVGNAVVWFGPRPASDPETLTIKLGPENQLSVVHPDGKPVNPGRIIWSAQGKAWVDGDGLLHPLETGETTIHALIDGVVYETKVKLQGTGKAKTDSD